MRKHVHLYATVLIVLAAASAGAQTFTPGVKGGIDFASLPKAGEVIDQVTKVPTTETSSKTGFMVGGFATMPIANHFAFQPELMFVGKGVSLSASNSTVTANIRYIEFPLLLRFDVTAGSNTGYFLAGPTFGVKAGTSAQVDAPNAARDVDIDAAIRSFDAGFAIAGGLDFGKYLLIEGRYTQGLTDVGSDVYPHVDSLKNRVLAILVGVRFKK